MKTSLRGQIAILSHEAIVLTRYKDSANIWTIGVGITAMAGASINPNTYTGEISLATAVSMFGEILPKYERMVDRQIAKYGLSPNQHEYDALVSLCYNLGSRPVGRFCQVWRDNGKSAAARKMMEYVNAAGKRIEGLVTRRRKEVALFNDGHYGSGRVSTYTASKSGRINWKSGRVVNAADLLDPTPPMALLPDVPNQVDDLIDEVDKGFMESNTDKANLLASAGGLGGVGSLFGFISNPWVQALLIVVMALILAAGVYIFMSRNRKRNMGREARKAL